MGSKHTPAKWWKDYAAECTAFDRNTYGIVAATRSGDLLTMHYRDGSKGYCNLRGIDKMQFDLGGES